MEDSMKNTAISDCKSCIQKLRSMKVKDSLDFSMKITCDDDTPCFDKTIRSESEFNLLKTLGVAMLVGAGISLLCALGSLFKK